MEHGSSATSCAGRYSACVHNQPLTNAGAIRQATDEGLTLWLLDGCELRDEIKAELDARQAIRQASTFGLLSMLLDKHPRRELILDQLRGRGYEAKPVTDPAAQIVVHAGVVEDYGLDAR